MERSNKKSKVSNNGNIVIDFGLDNGSDESNAYGKDGNITELPDKVKSSKTGKKKKEKKTIISNSLSSKKEVNDSVEKKVTSENTSKKVTSENTSKKVASENNEKDEDNTNDDGEYEIITKSKQLSVKKYKYKSWDKMYASYNIDFSNLNIDYSWRKLIESEMKKDYFKSIQKFLELSLTKTEGKVKMYPYPELVFSAFNHTPLNSVKVVILGQDPYINNECHNETIVPQAMGMSFSVPNGIKIPPSLLNIFKNLEKFGHIRNRPSNGNLTFWADQGVLMLNTALTVQHGYSNSHGSKWQPFTDTVIKYLSDNRDHLVFVLWGSPSLNKLNLIDGTKHKVVVSSHPSGLSCNSKLRQYPAFVNLDHFGEINSYLKQHKKRPIIWESCD